MGTLLDFVKKKVEEVDSDLKGLTETHVHIITALIQKDFGWTCDAIVDFENHAMYLNPKLNGAVIKPKRTDKIDKYLDSLPKALKIPDWKLEWIKPEIVHKIGDFSEKQST